jgi:hypothetical protein
MTLSLTEARAFEIELDCCVFELHSQMFFSRTIWQ